MAESSSQRAMRAAGDFEKIEHLLACDDLWPPPRRSRSLSHTSVTSVVFPRNSDTLECITTVCILGYSTCVNPPTADTHAQCIRAPRLRCRAQPTAAATQRCCCRAARIRRRTYPRIADPLALCSRLLRIQRVAVSDPLGYARPCSRAAPQQLRADLRRSEA